MGRPRGQGRGWTPDELETLEALAGSVGYEELAEILDRTYSSVAKKAITLGLKGRPCGDYYGQGFSRNKGTAAPPKPHSPNGGCSHKVPECTHHWTDEKDQFLRDNYGDMTSAQLAKAVGKTPHAVQFRTGQVLGLRRPNHRSWTEADDQYIRDHYLTQPHKILAEHLSRSWQAVAQRVLHLECRRGALIGAAHPLWRGGHAYGSTWGKVIRPAILLRDNYLCQHPGCDVFSPTGELLHVHHIVPRPLSFDDGHHNLVTLCELHHYAQDAHKWLKVTPALLGTLPGYQRVLLAQDPVDRWVPEVADAFCG